MLFKPTLALGLLLSAATLNADAASLSGYTVNGVDLVYSSVSDVTWTQDANLFKTLYDADNALVSQIASVTPSYNDPYWGLQNIDAGDFDTSDGRMSWWGGIAFVNYLNSLPNGGYGGSSQWRLPTSNTIVGYNGTAGNELGQLFYSELGGTQDNAIPDTLNFINEQAYAYWSVTETSPLLRYAWLLDTSNGRQYDSFKNLHLNAWVVSPGRVTAAVPEPGVMWLLSSGLLGLVSLKRRGHAG